jgi:hypothetical protein
MGRKWVVKDQRNEALDTVWERIFQIHIRPVLWGETMDLVEERRDHLYPGSALSSAEVLELADAFRESARQLLDKDPKRCSKASGPLRLLTIHAIELYLNAYLLASGLDASAIRGLQHDLKAREQLVRDRGMVLRVKTGKHLSDLTVKREYLVSRYDIPDNASLSALSRLTATMEEVRKRAIKQLAS